MHAHILRFAVFFLIAAAFKVLAVVSGLFAVAFDAPENDRRKGFVFVLSPWKILA